MYELFLAYFNKYPNKQWFFINNIIEELKLPQVYVSKQLEQLSREKPDIGYYNPDTGWFRRLTGYKPKKKNTKTYWLYMVISILAIVFFPYYYTPSVYSNPLFMTIGFILLMASIMILFHETFDKRAYLKDYKL